MSDSARDLVVYTEPRHRSTLSRDALFQAAVLAGCLFLAWAGNPKSGTTASMSMPPAAFLTPDVASAADVIPRSVLTAPNPQTSSLAVDLAANESSAVAILPDISVHSNGYSDSLTDLLAAPQPPRITIPQIVASTRPGVISAGIPMLDVGRGARLNPTPWRIDPTPMSAVSPATVMVDPNLVPDAATAPLQTLQVDPAHPGMVTAACIEQASQIQHVPVPIILGFLKTEGGWVGASVGNTNGSHDLGPMQVNDDTWVPEMARLEFNGNERLARLFLQWNGCYNVQVGTWIFRQYWNEANGDTPKAIGFYNSHDPIAASNYRARFAHSLMALFGPPAGAGR